MNKLLKRHMGLIVTVIVFLAITLSVIIPVAYSAMNDYCRLVEIDYKAVLEQNGSIEVTEKITFDVHAASKSPDIPDGATYWELWRALPETDEYGLEIRYDVKSVKRLTTNGEPDYLEFGRASDLYWENSDYNNPNYPDLSKEGYGPNRWFHSPGPYDDYRNFECVLIYVDGLYRERVEFEITYTMYNAALMFKDCTELYVAIYGDTEAKYLENVRGEFVIPNAQMPTQYNAYTYGTNAHTFPFNKVAGAQSTSFVFELGKDDLVFKPYNQYIEFALVSYGADAHKLAPLASALNIDLPMYANTLASQKEYEELPAKFKIIKSVLLVVGLGVAVVAMLIAFVTDKTKRKLYKLRKPEIPFTKFREIPSQEDVGLAGELVFCKHKLVGGAPGVFSATLLSLIKKRYISVEKVHPHKEWDGNNALITVKADDPTRELLTPSEDMHLKMIKKYTKENQILMKRLQSNISTDFDYAYWFSSTCASESKKLGIRKGYFQRNNYKEPKYNALRSACVLMVLAIVFMIITNVAAPNTRLDYAFGAFFIMGAGLILAALYTLKKCKSYVLLTQFGENEHAKWRGLYNFMQDETLLNEQTVEKIEMWEDYLIYATAFGIPEKVLKTLKMKFPEFGGGTSPIVNHPFLCSYVFISATNRSFRTASSMGRVSHFGSGLSGHGGYGGGGRGGGGGGGGH